MNTYLELGVFTEQTGVVINKSGDFSIIKETNQQQQLFQCKLRQSFFVTLKKVQKSIASPCVTAQCHLRCNNHVQVKKLTRQTQNTPCPLGAL